MLWVRERVDQRLRMVTTSFTTMTKSMPVEDEQEDQQGAHVDNLAPTLHGKGEDDCAPTALEQFGR